jgi:hypothetical protein
MQHEWFERLATHSLSAMCNMIALPCTVVQIVVRHRMHHEWFERLASKLLSAEPPCCSDAEDWEDAGGWAAELDALAEAAAQQPPAMPLDPGAC